jgi:hypothetical protein
VRVLVEWHKLQPDPTRPPDLATPRGGCLRDLPPCAPHAGVRAQLEAVAALRRAGRDVTAVLQPYGVPDWAATAPRPCERDGARPDSRAIRPEALPAYRALLRALATTAEEVGLGPAEAQWWSPWNEPNHPAFIARQRARCDAAAPAVAPQTYAALVREARAELGPRARLLLGDLAGTRRPSRVDTTVAEFVAGLPDDVACEGAAWAVHQYVGPAGTAAERDAGGPGAPDAVRVLARALDRRPCTAGRPIWVTETGAGALRPGRARDGTRRELVDGCRQLARTLRRWDADPRVAAVFPYTAREDPLFPVGLVDPTLTEARPALALLQAWGAAGPDDPPPGAEACGPVASGP